MNISSISSIGGSDSTNGSKGNLRDVTTREEHHISTERVTEPIDLTAVKLKEIGLETDIARFQKSVVRLRVEVNGKSIGAGSGIIISSDGLILSVNHVPALGQSSSGKPFDLVSGTHALKNLKTWSEVLTGKGEARLVADFPLLPESDPPETIFTKKKEGLNFELSIKPNFSKGKPATAYGMFDDTIKLKTLPVQIIAESPGEDLMLARIVQPSENDPFSFLKITDTVPSSGDFVYSIGHPKAIKHNALALGEVLDPNFNIKKIEDSIRAHGLILGGLSNALGGGAKGGSLPGNALAGLSTAFAGVDLEALVKFMNGAVISTNNIDHGSSGGLLCNGAGEVVGVTYLGFLIPFNDSFLLKYAAGTLGFSAKQLPLSSLTGSVGMTKAIPFLEEHGVRVQKIRDGEPSGIEAVQQRTARNRARVSMTEAYRAVEPSITEDEIERRLAAAGFPKEVEEVVQPVSKNVKSGYEICGVDLSSKPVKVLSMNVGYNTEDPDQASLVVINANFQTESNPKGEPVRLEIDPRTFDLNTFADEETKKLVMDYLLQEEGNRTLCELQKVQQKVEENLRRDEGGENLLNELKLFTTELT